MTKIAPSTSTTVPTQSPIDHVRRRARAQRLDQPTKSSASTSTIGITTSSVRTSGATTEATIAAAGQRLPRTTNALTIRNKHSAAYGYASVSSTMNDE